MKDLHGLRIALPVALADRGFSLRPEVEADSPFLLELYATSRDTEMAMLTEWPVEQKQAFLAHQFAAQRHHYRTRITDCVFDVIERDGEPVGRLYTQRTQNQFRIIDIALLPTLRGQGVGTAILTHLLAEADRAGLPTGLFVEPYNPALRLYRRLGFETVRQVDFHVEMERLCPGHPEAEIAASGQLKTAS